MYKYKCKNKECSWNYPKTKKIIVSKKRKVKCPYCGEFFSWFTRKLAYQSYTTFHKEDELIHTIGGGAVGFLLGGPLGMCIGAIAGSQLHKVEEKLEGVKDVIGEKLFFDDDELE